MQYKGRWCESVHGPIISRELFNRVQQARRRRSSRAGTTSRKTSRVYPLSGVARCARCGGPVRGTNSSVYRYYRDSARDKGLDYGQGMISSDKAEDVLGDFLRQLSLPKNWQERVSAQQEIAQEKARIEGQLERLKRLFVLGDPEEAEYCVERDQLRSQLVAATPLAMADLE